MADSERGLTEDGIKIVKASAGNLKNFIRTIDVIVSSPMKRALQTAKIIRETFGVEGEIISDNSLLNGGKTEDILLLAESLGKEHIAMIGHQPDLSQHISRIISSAEINLKLPAASAAKISFEGQPATGKGVLEFLIPPGK